MPLRYSCLLLFLLLTAALPATAQIGSCDLGTTSALLDGNNVRARLYNNGGLFWRGSGNTYTVPKDGTANAIFAAGLWIGGLDPDGNHRFAGTAFGPWEFWPGPIDENTHLPVNPGDCSAYDRIWVVNRDDLGLLALGNTTDDIRQWPWHLGAPVTDGDGKPDNYDLKEGDRPALVGDEMAWWVMNDAGNNKGWSETPPMGLEIQVTAFAFASDDAMDNTTFYRYKIIHKGEDRFEDMYFGFWTDGDLGDASDDYVGSDSTLGMMYYYNGDNVDAGVDGYGTSPPALGFDFVQGPLVPAPGQTWTDPDSTVHTDSTRLQMNRFLYYNGDSSPIGNPTGNTREPYDYLRGIWRDGTPMTHGGTGYNPGSTNVTRYIFPGDPVTGSYWSEENTDGRGSRNTPADRRGLMSTGPFDFAPGQAQEIVLAIVWSQTPNRLASVAQLRRDDILVQGRFDLGFLPATFPDPPQLTATPDDETVILEWANLPTSNNYLSRFDTRSPFLVDPQPFDDNTTYTFEGYRVLQYDGPEDTEGTVIATYDVPNNVQVIGQDRVDPTTGFVERLKAYEGTDSGVQYYHVVEDVVNYQTYYFGVQAYAYNPNSKPEAIASAVERVEVVPRPVGPSDGGTELRAARGEVLVSELAVGSGSPDGVVAEIVNPQALTGHRYEVHIFDLVAERGELVDTDGDGRPDTPAIEVTHHYYNYLFKAFTFHIIDATRGDTLLNALRFWDERKEIPAFGKNVIQVDGLAFSLSGPPDDFERIEAVANANGPIPEGSRGAVSSWQSFPGAAPTASAQQANGQRPWIFHTADNGSRASYSAFVNRITNGGEIGNFVGRIIIPYDFEMRFTANGSRAYDPFITACYFNVPFELWRIGIGTPDDPSDDVKMVPYVLDDDATSLYQFDGNDAYNLFSQKTHDALEAEIGRAPFATADHSGSSLNNDPQTDWVYWTTPDNTAPGTAGYDAWQAHMDNAVGLGNCDDGSQFGRETTDNSLRRTVLFQWNGGDVCNDTDGDGTCERPAYHGNLPEVGTVFRLTTKKPLAAGDVFALDTAPVAAERQREDVAESSLSEIGIVPNPYKGSSAYEVSARRDEVRFTGMPDAAVVRIYTLSGTLVRRLDHRGGGVLRWDLTSSEGLSLASGMYLVHVSVPGVGQKVIKFGLIQGRTTLNVF